MGTVPLKCRFFSAGTSGAGSGRAGEGTVAYSAALLVSWMAENDVDRCSESFDICIDIDIFTDTDMIYDTKLLIADLAALLRY